MVRWKGLENGDIYRKRDLGSFVKLTDGEKGKGLRSDGESAACISKNCKGRAAPGRLGTMRGFMQRNDKVSFIF